ncbi:MAG: hypothetical protein KAS23_05075, partial [Anaerohalosphaera sp.]|nr:hypothetical protein [Anaerohalosphaera sp.]
MTSRNVCKCLSVKCLVLFVLFLTVDTSYAVDPDNPPESMRVRVDKSGSPRTFNLEKYSCRGENFELILMGVDGVSMTTIDPGPVRTYRGWCEEEPESYVEATLLSNGDLRYHVFKGASDDWWYDPAFETNENAAAEGNFSEVGGTAVQPKGRAAYGASFTEPAGELDSYYKTAYQADVGFDVLVEYFNKFNYTDLSTYGHKAENAIMHMNGISVRDMLAEHKLGKVVIRQSQNGMDYTNVQWGVDWPRINDVWNSLFPDVDHHFVSLVGAVGGGVAFVCDYAGANWGARSFNGWSGDGNWWHVWRHEAGHNWGCGDCVEGCPGPDGRTVNSGNNITLSRFSNPEIDQFMKCRRRSGRGNILHEIGSYPFPVPPYANLDELQATVGSEALFDLLGNDYDANNDIIAFSSFDASTSLGGLLSLSAGTGPDGRDELLYIAPGNAVGTDVFYYTIVDATGRTSVGKVTVNLDVNGALKGYWPLDETSGLNAEDMSIFEHDGLAENGLSFSTDSVSGRFDGAIDLDGVDQHIAINDLNLYSNTVTISAWVKVPSNPAGWSGIVFNRATDAAGISFGAATELRYHWNGGNWGWGSGLSVPLDTWTFVAIVVEPTKAVIYMNSGGTTRSAAHYGTHEPEAFKGTTYIGWDSSSSSRHMRGSVDDVRIYNYAMSLAQINDLVAGGRAESPSPFDNAGNITLTTKLSWAMGAGAAENDVYFGTNESVVANADVNSDEYMGRQTQTEYEPTLLTNTNYFWRIDQVDTQGSVTIGTVWDFSTSDGTGSITRQVWQDVYGAYVYELTNNDAYPDSPDIVDEITSFEAPTDWADSYGTRIHGFLAPKVSGNYTFWIASDDRSELWLSSNTDPDNAVKIAEVSGIINAWTEPRQWDKHASQRSNSIKLTAGKAYYIMALQKEGNGGDNLSVAWQGGGITQQVITGQYLMPYSDKYVWGPSFES